MVMVAVVSQEVWVNIQFGVQVETAQIKHLRQAHLTEMHHFLRRARVHVLQAVLQSVQLSGRHQVSFADEDLVCKAHLAARLLAVVELLGGVFGVDQGQDGVEQEAFGNFIVHEERLCHRAWVGQTRRLDHDAVKVEQTFAFFGG